MQRWGRRYRQMPHSERVVVVNKMMAAAFEFFEGFDPALEQFRHYKALKPFQVLGGFTMIALNRSEFHNLRKAHCQSRVRYKGRKDYFTEYCHSVPPARTNHTRYRFVQSTSPVRIKISDADEWFASSSLLCVGLVITHYAIQFIWAFQSVPLRTTFFREPTQSLTCI